jgi:ABC-2 type transport system permease protein
MSLATTRAVLIRVVRQLRHDRRTLGLVLVVPPLLLWLMDAVFTNSPGVFDRIGPMMLGLYPFLLMFVITSIALVRERTQGTLDRLMASPIGRGDILVGYAAGFTLIALLQSAIALAVGLGPLDLPNAGSLWLTCLLVVGQSLLGITLGLCLSVFARNEFQAVQFLPAVVLPQIFLAGLLVPVDHLPRVLEAVARVLPLTYAFEAMDRIMREGHGLSDPRVLLDLTVVFAMATLFLLLGALTLRRVEA